MRLAIADPPYLGRANRWYGIGRGHRGGIGRAAAHEAAAEWNNPATHVRRCVWMKGKAIPFGSRVT